MNALQEAKNVLDNFIDKNITCASCKWWEKELFGGICNGPEIKLGFFEDDKNTCEQHEFRETELQRQFEILHKLWGNAWYIVEGFLYFMPAEGEL